MPDTAETMPPPRMPSLLEAADGDAAAAPSPGWRLLPGLVDERAATRHRRPGFGARAAGGIVGVVGLLAAVAVLVPSSRVAAPSTRSAAPAGDPASERARVIAVPTVPVESAGGARIERVAIEPVPPGAPATARRSGAATGVALRQAPIPRPTAPAAAAAPVAAARPLRAAAVPNPPASGSTADADVLLMQAVMSHLAAGDPRDPAGGAAKRPVDRPPATR